MKQVFLLLLVLLSGNVYAQDETCYTQWEKDLFDKINDYRKSKNLPAFIYSPQLTKAALANVDGSNPNAYPRTTTGYNGIGSRLSYEFKFDHTTAQDAMDVYEKYYDQDLNNTTYIGLGIARIQNKVITWLGAQAETPASLPTCTPVASNKPYTWIFKPDSDFWEIAHYHIGKYIVMRNITYWGVIDTTGRVVLDFQYWTMSPYYIEGQFIVTKTREDKQEYIIDTTGKIVETFAHDGYIMLDKNRIAYEGNFNYIVDEKGKRLTEKYNDIYPIGKNKLAFLNKNNLYGIMDFDGKILVQPKYGEIMGYSEYLAAVKVGSKWGFIDTSFNMSIQPIATEKQDFYFSNGMVPVKINNKVGYMDNKGKIVIAPKYEVGDHFGENGYAPVHFNGKYGVINKKGETVMPFEYISAMPFENGYGAVAKLIDGDVLFAIVDYKGKILTDFEFSQLYFLPDHIKAKGDGRWGMLRMK